MAISLRPASETDLDHINRIIEAAVMGWNLPQRVKRLSLPSYRYQPLDLEHLQLLVAENSAAQMVGVAAWEPAAPQDTPGGASGLLLHGLYVLPEQQRRGIGGRLLQAAEQAARQQGYQGLLVRAQQDAEDFFRGQGLQQLAVEDPARHYAGRFWKAL